jgi:hypothetical protein
MRLRVALRRLNDRARRFGVAEAIRITARKARRLAYSHEAQIWYRLGLSRPRPHLLLPAGLVLQRVETGDSRFVDQLPNLTLDDTERRLLVDRDLWIVHDRGRVVFACWICRTNMLVTATRDLDFELPHHVVGLDDAVGGPSVLAQGIASAAWSRIADALELDGVTAVLSKAGENDLAGRRAMEEAGFTAVAALEVLCLGHRFSVEVRPLVSDALAAHLVEQVRGGSALTSE